MPSCALPEIIAGVRAFADPTPVAVKRRAYLPKEFAKLCGVHPATAYRWISAGYVKSETRAGFTLIPVDEALRFSREGVPR